MTSQEELRLECLRLAIGVVSPGLASTGPGDEARIVKIAREFTDFVDGRRDAEVIRAASELAEKVKAG